MKGAGLTDEQIEYFTGHDGDSELQVSYLDDNTIENKLKWSKKLKIGKGL